MNLITAHKILIAAAIVFFGFFAVLEGAHDHYITSFASAIASVLFQLYYRWISKTYDKEGGESSPQ